MTIPFVIISSLTTCLYVSVGYILRKRTRQTGITGASGTAGAAGATGAAASQESRKLQQQKKVMYVTIQMCFPFAGNLCTPELGLGA